MENRFNLINEPWIPVTGVGRVSLRQMFTQLHYRRLGGNPVQKIAVLKFLLAIAQAAVTPETENAWKKLSPDDLAGKCLAYLGAWQDRFYLYGKKPFLQIPAIMPAKEQSDSALLPEIATGNTTVLFQSQIEKKLDDADRAMLLLVVMGFALGGKKTDNSVVLSKGYQGKTKENGRPTTGKPGPAVSNLGLLHTFFWAETIIETLFLNLMTHENISDCGLFDEGVGTAPWEKMPQGEDCSAARALKNSLMGRLVPLSRFCLLNHDKIHCSEGIAHLNYLDGIHDPSVAVDTSGTKNKVLWTDPENPPWRQLPALLGCIKKSRGKFDCLQLRISLPRAVHPEKKYCIWSGGLRVSSNAGEQYVSGGNDFVESEVALQGKHINSKWLDNLEAEMIEMGKIAGKLYGCITGFFDAQSYEGKAFAAQGANMFWQLCENDFQKLIYACDDIPNAARKRYLLRQKFSHHIYMIYDQICANDTARQMEAWTKCRPNLFTYLEKGDL